MHDFSFWILYSFLDKFKTLVVDSGFFNSLGRILIESVLITLNFRVLIVLKIGFFSSFEYHDSTLETFYRVFDAFYLGVIGS